MSTGAASGEFPLSAVPARKYTASSYRSVHSTCTVIISAIIPHLHHLSATVPYPATPESKDTRTAGQKRTERPARRVHRASFSLCKGFHTLPCTLFSSITWRETLRHRTSIPGPCHFLLERSLSHLHRTRTGRVLSTHILEGTSLERPAESSSTGETHPYSTAFPILLDTNHHGLPPPTSHVRHYPLPGVRHPPRAGLVQYAPPEVDVLPRGELLYRAVCW